MVKVESKIGTIQSSKEEIFNFLTDFNNFKDLIPSDKIKNWQSSENSCSFSIDGAGELKIKIINKEPYKTIKYEGEGTIPFNFWVQLKQLLENDTKIKLTVKAELNMMMKMVVEKPLKKALDTIVDQLALFFEKKADN